MDYEYKVDSDALKKIMIDKKIKNITEFSLKSGVNRNTLSKILKNDGRPSSDVMDKIVNTLELSPENAGAIFFVPYLRNM